MTSYFGLLRAELAEQPFVKARINREVQALTGRSRGSVARKCQNISAILLALGAVFVDGHKPLGNVQQALRDAVIAGWMAQPDIEDLMLAQGRAACAPASAGSHLERLSTPLLQCRSDGDGSPPANSPAHRLLKLEADRRDLGRVGEEAVVRFERDRLLAQGRQRLARMVEDVSLTRGDGLGHDVLSFDEHGDESPDRGEDHTASARVPVLDHAVQSCAQRRGPRSVPAVPPCTTSTS